MLGQYIILVPCLPRLPYNLYCVGGDVKHCTLAHALPALSCLQFYVSISMGGNVSIRASGVDASDSEGRDAKVGFV